MAWQKAAHDAGHTGPYDNRDTVAKLFKLGAGICALVDGAPVAYVVFQAVGAIREIYIVEVCPEFRHQGIGRLLLEGAEAQLRATGAECLTVTCVTPEGESLARRCGFTGPASQHGPGIPYTRLDLQKSLTE
jgi:GNAT superfamily N-acetyltransferase